MTSPQPGSGTPAVRPSGLPPWADEDLPRAALDAQGASRRDVLRRGGLLGAGFVVAAGPAAGAESAQARPAPVSRQDEEPELVWLVGDHHVHTRYSSDAKYGVSQQAQRGAQFGLDWMAITEHSNLGHVRAGAAAGNAEVVAAREENPRMLIFQGLEWYIPAAEHGTVLVAPGPGEVQLLTDFETRFDGNLTGRSQGAAGHPSTPANERAAVEALAWLGEQRGGLVDDVLVIANHPSRLGIDSPHEIRGWRDADPEVAIGMEGAPGAQGDAEPAWVAYRGTSGNQRGEYSNAPRPDSFAGYPPEAYRTYGGFDWMTATVGGLWDSMLAEGRLWTITSNSDNHRTIFDTFRDGELPPGATFETAGAKPPPVDTGVPQPGSDFWPGQFSRTHVGVTAYGYLQVMEGLRAGRVWVDHGQLVDGLEVRVRAAGRGRTPRPTGRGVPLGGSLRVNRGEQVVLEVTVTTASRPNLHGVLPELAHLDVIRGEVTGPVADRDDWRAPGTRVAERLDVRGRRGTYTLTVPLGYAEGPSYVRLRGSDGQRNGPGLLGADVDPAGPLPHPPGDGDPWSDTWLYTNPVFVDTRR